MKIISKQYIIPTLAVLGLLAYATLFYTGHPEAGRWVLMSVLIAGTLPLLWKMARDILRGHFGVDLIAMVAIVVAFVLGEYLAGAVIVLMLSGGEALEEYALNRSSRELTKLLSRAPSVAHVKLQDKIVDVKASEVKPEDLLLVKKGEIIPVDGLVINGESEVDEASITGEPLPVRKEAGSLLYSGSINEDNVLEYRATKHAHESQYERIVKLVKQAQESRAPVVRLADRYAVGFTLVSFVIAFGAYFFSGDWVRFLAVLVVATPCPLILATPIAIISGISRSALRGVIVKDGGALEKLGEARAMVFDKTGTLTLGEPKLEKIVSLNSEYTENQILTLAASLDQLSAHILARSIVESAKKTGKQLVVPENFTESLGSGVEGVLAGKKYIFGKYSFLKKAGLHMGKTEEELHEFSDNEGKIIVFLSDGQAVLGYAVFADILRPEIKQAFHEMSDHNIEKMFMLTGDKEAVAKKAAAALGIAEYRSEMLPEDKVLEVEKIKTIIRPVAMVGDGINDAPALAAADVGIALAGHGSSAASEAGDIVIMVNNFMRVHDALHIAQETMKIAKQSIFVGMGLSVAAMVAASLGYLPPVYGALLQEAIDVAVILNALRVNFVKV